MKTKFYEYGIPSSTLIKTVEGTLIPHMPEDTTVEVDGSSYAVKNWNLLIQGDEQIVVIYLK